MKRTYPYSAAVISDDIKTHLAQLYILERGQGTKRKDFVNKHALSGLVFSERQLDRWVARINNGDTAISIEKQSGLYTILHREKRDIVCGWVLNQNELGIAVHLESYCDFCEAQFRIKLTHMTASNYLREDGFSYRTMQKKGASFVIDVAEMRQGLWKFVEKQIFPLKPLKPERICSIDFTFTGHRTEKRSGFAPKGGAQPMESTSVSTYTNCIVTCVWADGLNRTPPILYTYNPVFRRDRNPTERREAQIEHLNECFRRYGITAERVVYIGKDKGEKEHYAKECPELVRLFFETYQVGTDVTVLSDNGNSFFENGESVITQLGFEKHIFYPADVHQYLSPNDNRLHGTAKQAWRAGSSNYSDDIESCLSLLYYLDRDIVAHSQHWFDKNMLSLGESEVANLVSARGPKFSHLHKGWLRAYRIFMGEDARGLMPKLPDNLNDGLDGLFWL